MVGVKEVEVRTVSGQKHSFFVGPHTTVLEMKAKMREEFGKHQKVQVFASDGRRLHDTQSLFTHTHAGEVLHLAVDISGGGVKKDYFLKDGKMDKRDKMAVYEARFAAAYKNITDPELKAVADGFRQGDAGFMSALIKDMCGKGLEEAIDLLTANTGSGKKAMPALRQVLPLMVPELAAKERLAADIGKDIGGLYDGWECYVNQLFLSQGGFLYTEALSSMLCQQQEANERAAAEAAAKEQRRQEAGLGAKFKVCGDWGCIETCVGWAWDACGDWGFGVSSGCVLGCSVARRWGLGAVCGHGGGGHHLCLALERAVGLQLALQAEAVVRRQLDGTVGGRIMRMVGGFNIDGES
jgi:hypothetical protein